MICALLTEVASEFWPFAADPGSPHSTCRSCFSCAVFPHGTGAAQRRRLATAPVPVAHWPNSNLPPPPPGPCDTPGFVGGLGSPWGLNPCVYRLQVLVRRCRGANWFGQPSRRRSTSCPTCLWHQRDKLWYSSILQVCLQSWISAGIPCSETNALQTPKGDNVMHDLSVN